MSDERHIDEPGDGLTPTPSEERLERLLAQMPRRQCPGRVRENVMARLSRETTIADAPGPAPPPARTISLWFRRNTAFFLEAAALLAVGVGGAKVYLDHRAEFAFRPSQRDTVRALDEAAKAEAPEKYVGESMRRIGRGEEGEPSRSLDAPTLEDDFDRGEPREKRAAPMPGRPVGPAGSPEAVPVEAPTADFTEVNGDAAVELDVKTGREGGHRPSATPTPAPLAPPTATPAPSAPAPALRPAAESIAADRSATRQKGTESGAAVHYRRAVNGLAGQPAEPQKAVAAVEERGAPAEGELEKKAATAPAVQSAETEGLGVSPRSDSKASDARLGVGQGQAAGKPVPETAPVKALPEAAEPAPSALLPPLQPAAPQEPEVRLQIEPQQQARDAAYESSNLYMYYGGSWSDREAPSTAPVNLYFLEVVTSPSRQWALAAQNRIDQVQPALGEEEGRRRGDLQDSWGRFASNGITAFNTLANNFGGQVTSAQEVVVEPGSRPAVAVEVRLPGENRDALLNAAHQKRLVAVVPKGAPAAQDGATDRYRSDAPAREPFGQPLARAGLGSGLGRIGEADLARTPVETFANFYAQNAPMEQAGALVSRAQPTRAVEGIRQQAKEAAAQTTSALRARASSPAGATGGRAVRGRPFVAGGDQVVSGALAGGYAFGEPHAPMLTTGTARLYFILEPDPLPQP